MVTRDAFVRLNSMFSHRNNTLIVSYMYRYTLILLVFITLLGALMPNVGAVIESGIDTRQADISGQSDSSNQTQPKRPPQIKLQLAKNDTSTKSDAKFRLDFGQSKIGDSWNNRHSYDISVGETNEHSKNASNALKTSTTTTTTTTTTTSTPSPTRESYANSTDDLETSHSRYSLARISPRSDQDEADTNYNNNEDDYLSNYADNGEYGGYIDGASSNLNEKKVVKELTKILSKGMSGASGQVRLETLENWKRRQRDRKVVKDTRAKLFEDLLTAAISSHPERFKSGKSKGSQQSSKDASSYSTGLKSSSSSGASNLPSNVAEMDPELSTDAETVIQHLQGIATAIDSHSPPSPSSYEAAGQSSDDPGEAEPDSQSGAADESGEDTTSGETEKPPTTAKKPANERRLVKQFKKIKNQLSQRRKQLDQIKKLFNVELAINPKDGTLMGKPAGGGGGASGKSGKGKKKHQAEQSSSDGGYIDYTDDSGPPTPNKRKSSSNGGSSSKDAKMNELMSYLRENPEILASVMAELTVDADPSKALPTLSRQHDDSAADMVDMNLASLSNRKTVQARPHRSLAPPPADPTDVLMWERARRISRLYEPTASLPSPLDLPDSRQLLRKSRLRNLSGEFQSLRSLDNNNNISSPSRQASRVRSAEALLLESLRERQLLNLARLDMVLAEKQLASNRSSLFSSLNAPASISRQDSVGSYQRPTYKATQSLRSSNVSLASPQVPQTNRGDDNGELTHHFMVVSPNSTETTRHTSDFLNIQPNPMQYQLSNGASIYSRAFDPPGSQVANNQPGGQVPINGQAPYPMGNQLPLNANIQPPLKRFRDWRDVSQPEASSTLYERTNSPNNNNNQTQATNWNMKPYDLTTGSSSAASIESSQPIRAHQNQPIQSPYVQNYDQRPMMAANDTYQRPQQQQQQQFNLDPAIQSNTQQVADVSVTRPGTANMVNTFEPFQRPPAPVMFNERPTLNPINSIFMTRSSITQNADVKPDRPDAERDEARSPGRGGADITTVRLKDNNNADPRRDFDDDDDSGDVNNNIGRSSTNDEAEGQARMTTIDYFSSYKQEMPTKKAHGSPESPPGRRKRDRARLYNNNNNNNNNIDRSDDQSVAGDDDMGAMWAK